MAPLVVPDARGVGREVDPTAVLVQIDVGDGAPAPTMNPESRMPTVVPAPP